MAFKIIAFVESFGESGFIAWVESEKMKGIVTSGETPEEAISELMTSLKVKIAYDMGIDISSIKQVRSKEELKKLAHVGRNEMNLDLAPVC